MWIPSAQTNNKNLGVKKHVLMQINGEDYRSRNFRNGSFAYVYLYVCVTVSSRFFCFSYDDCLTAKVIATVRWQELDDCFKIIIKSLQATL